MANSGQQGAGKHPHKSTQEPYSHTKDNKGGSHSSHASGGSKASGSQSSSHSSRGSSESSDLKSREYRDAQGNIHHHTHTVGKGGDKR